jgi:hypothetical protein
LEPVVRRRCSLESKWLSLIAIDTARSHVDCERRIDCSIGYAILWLMENRRKSLILLVSAAGLEPATP